MSGWTFTARKLNCYTTRIYAAMTAYSGKLKTFCALKSNAKDANCCIFMN